MTYFQAVFDLAILATLIFASVSDVKTRIVPPKYQITLGAFSLAHMIAIPIIQQDFKLFLNYLLSGLFVFAIYIGAILIFKTGIGGADTKVTSIMAAFLGWRETICFVVSHAIVAIGFSLYSKSKLGIKVKSVPLMPFLTAGFLITKGIFWFEYFGLLGTNILIK